MAVERGSLVQYQIIWKSGYVEEIQAHQVTTRGGPSFLAPSPLDKPEVVMFHGEFDGRWQLVLSAPMDDISTIRNLSVAGEEADRG